MPGPSWWFSFGCTAVVLAAAAPPREARACGGFFCQQTPVDQSGERIAFFVDDGKVTAHVQIFYQGAAREFAWVVPVASVPTLDVGTDELFRRLDSATAPRFSVSWEGPSTCSSGTGSRCTTCKDAGSGFRDAGAAPGGSGVEVVAVQAVGPYDTAIVRSDDPQALQQWLTANGYDLRPEAVMRLEPYIAQGYVFVALKLRQDRTAGDIEPLVMQFEEASPCIPLRLTAIAAQADMSVTAFVFGPARAVPQNYFHVQLNEAAISWMSGGSNYRTLVSRAADEGSGNAFVTEFAGQAEPVRRGLWSPLEDSRIEALRSMTDPVAFVGAVSSLGLSSATILALLRVHLPVPPELAAQGITENLFYNCLVSRIRGSSVAPEGLQDCDTGRFRRLCSCDGRSHV
jgi:hypothetical protein